jgi:choline-sulfatase
MAENTTILFTSDHGDMLGEFGLWYKMSFREWSCRIPMIVHCPNRFQSRRVPNPVAQVDMLPTLLDLAHESTGVEVPDPIDPLQGRSLLPLCEGNAANDPNCAISEYLAEGTGAPMLMICRGCYKFITCPTDSDQLFDLECDPNEVNNLVEAPEETRRLTEFQAEARQHWDAEALRKRVIREQERRRRVHAALRIGRYQSWDFDPKRDASTEYTRSHLDLTKFDITSRFPRPKPFKPR